MDQLCFSLPNGTMIVSFAQPSSISVIGGYGGSRMIDQFPDPLEHR